MPGSTRKLPVWLPILVLLIAMSSIQSGASLAKSLFPLVGAPGVTALRLALGTLILIAFFKPWRLRFAKEQRLPLLFYGLSLGGMNYLFYLSIQTVPLGIAVALEFTGPLAVALFSSRRPVDFIWVVLAVLGLWFLLPLGQDMSHVDLTGAALARRWRLLGCLYSYRPASRRGTWSGHGGGRLADCRHHFRADWRSSGWRCAMALVDSSLRVSGRCAFYGAALFTGNDCADAPANPHLRYADEHGTRAGRRFRDDFLGETLTGIQIMALCAIIAASMGSTLTIRREPQIKQVDVK